MTVDIKNTIITTVSCPTKTGKPKKYQNKGNSETVTM
jgi:hypothetical protein